MSFNRYIKTIPVALVLLFVAGMMDTASAQTYTPNGVMFLGGTDTFACGNNTYEVTVQLTLDGAPYPFNGCRVFLSSNKDFIITVPEDYVLADKEGKATFNISTAGSTGDVNITATALSQKSGISATKTFHVVNYDTINGLVTDRNYAGISGANVTLYSLNADGSKGSVVKVANNPQVSSDESAGTSGIYMFENVAEGSYYIEAEKDGKTGFSLCNVTDESPNVNVRIEEYIVPSATPTQEPAATPAATQTATPIPSPAGNDTEATGILITAIAASLVMIAIVFLYRLIVKR